MSTNAANCQLFLEPLCVLVEVLLIELVSPVLERLPDHGADVGVVPVAASLHDLGDQVVLPPSLLAATVGPALDLSPIVISSSPLIKPKS